MDPDQKLPQDQGHPGKNGEISFVTKTLGGTCQSWVEQNLFCRANFGFVASTLTKTSSSVHIWVQIGLKAIESIEVGIV